MLGIVGILVLLLVVRPLVIQLVESQAAGAPKNTNLLGAPGSGHPALAAASPQGALAATGGGALGAPGAEGALPADQGGAEFGVDRMIDMNKVDGRVRASSIKKIGEIVEKHPEESVAIVRSWLYQEE